jgi:hypothetical protein
MILVCGEWSIYSFDGRPPLYDSPKSRPASRGTLVMRRKHLLTVTASGEVVAGILVALSPSAVLSALLGIERAAPEAIVLARLFGAAIVAIGFGCWLGRSDTLSPAQRGLIAGALVYDVAAALVLAYAGLFLDLAGLALWPAVVAHAALGAWCAVSLRSFFDRQPADLLNSDD